MFVDCLVRLPNLKTLEILGMNSVVPISNTLERKCARFPSIRELRIIRACHDFIRHCPNLENLTFTDGFDTQSPATVRSHGGGLKRVGGALMYAGYCVESLYGELRTNRLICATAQRGATQRLPGAVRTFRRSASLAAST